MYHVTFSKNGKILLDTDSECAVALAKRESGFQCAQGGIVDFDTALGLVLSMDRLMNMMFDDHPELRLAYLLHDQLVETTSIDLSHLIRALNTNENEEEE